MTKPIYACLWFNTNVKEVTDFYFSIFKNGKILETNPMVTTFEINNTKFMALNGGPVFQFSPAISLVIDCDTQEQIDYYWKKLGDGGKYSHCGWLTDKYGISWQIVPSILGKLMSDPEKAPKVASLFRRMSKFEIAPFLNI